MISYFPGKTHEKKCLLKIIQKIIMKIICSLLSVAIVILFFSSCHFENEKKYKGWEVYGGNKENNHYSSLTQIDTGNVAQLQVAWAYHTGDSDKMTQIQVNPVIIENTLYGVSPKLKLFALDAATGKEKWSFNPASENEAKGKGY